MRSSAIKFHFRYELLRVLFPTSLYGVLVLRLHPARALLLLLFLHRRLLLLTLLTHTLLTLTLIALIVLTASSAASTCRSLAEGVRVWSSRVPGPRCYCDLQAKCGVPARWRWRHGMSYHVMSRPVIFRPVMSCCVVSCPVVLCGVMPRRVALCCEMSRRGTYFKRTHHFDSRSSPLHHAQTHATHTHTAHTHSTHIHDSHHLLSPCSHSCARAVLSSSYAVLLLVCLPTFST